MSILIVEDDPVNAMMVSRMLQAAGYQTKTANNGKEALSALASTSKIRLIITDYMMPEMDGLELIEKVRALPTYSHVPVLIASAHGDLETVKRAKHLQCGYLLKPITKQQVTERVRQLLELAVES